MVIKVKAKKATYVDLTDQYKILFILSVAALTIIRVLRKNCLVNVRVMHGTCPLSTNLLCSCEILGLLHGFFLG